MRMLLRACGLLAVALMLMRTATYDLNDIGAPAPSQRAAAPGSPVPWRSVVWSLPSTYYPQQTDRHCSMGNTMVVLSGRRACMACGYGATLVRCHMNYACATCLPGYTYHIFGGNAACRPLG